MVPHLSPPGLALRNVPVVLQFDKGYVLLQDTNLPQLRRAISWRWLAGKVAPFAATILSRLYKCPHPGGIVYLFILAIPSATKHQLGNQPQYTIRHLPHRHFFITMLASFTNLVRRS